MSSIVQSIPHTQQPQYPAPVAKGSRPIAREFFRNLWSLSASSPGIATTKNGSAALLPCPVGISASFFGLTEASYLTVPGWTARANDGSFTMAAVVIQRSATGIQYIVNGDNGGSNRAFHFRVNAGNFELVQFNTSPSGFVAGTTTAIPLNQPVLLVARYDGVSKGLKVWVNGVAGATTATLTGTAVGDLAATIQIGARSASAGSSFQGEIVTIERWLDALSDGQILTLGNSAADYFSRAFAPMQRSLWAPSAGAAPSFTPAWNSAANSVIQGGALHA